MSIFSRLKQQVSALENWYLETPERSLDASYRAAAKIKQIEDEHFNGRRVGPGFGHSPATLNYFEAELQKLLKTVRMRLTEFKACNRFINIEQQRANYSAQRLPSPSVVDSLRDDPSETAGHNSSSNYETYTLNQQQYSTNIISNNLSVLSVIEKLQYIDAILQRYRPPTIEELTTQLNPQPEESKQRKANSLAVNKAGKVTEGSGTNGFKPDSLYNQGVISDEITAGNKLDSSSFIPRSILRTADRFRRELNAKPETEEEVIKDFRNSKVRTRIAIRFILLLALVPLLAQQLSKSFIVSPLIDTLQVRGQISQIEDFVNTDIEEKILRELNRYQDRLKFQRLIGDPNSVNTPVLDEQMIQTQLKQKAIDLSNKYRWELTEPIKNIISDLFGLGAFSILIVTGKQKITIFKSFIDDVVYGLSDSAKAFILILLTDVFVGFHSPHGWMVVMRNVLEHFGLPRNDEFIDMFIATFPVMLDTVFKYWIFRYLNQVSPSAVATYRNMNE
jgi:hypothetical protein